MQGRWSNSPSSQIAADAATRVGIALPYVEGAHKTSTLLTASANAQGGPSGMAATANAHKTQPGSAAAANAQGGRVGTAARANARKARSGLPATANADRARS